MKVLITGDKGFIGTNLTKRLKNEKAIIISHQENESIDILNKNLFSFVKDVDTIIHLAAKTSIKNALNAPYDTYYTNILGTLNVLDFARSHNIKNIVNISTYVYGKPLYLPIDEKHALNPHTPYNKSKIISENLCKHYSQDYGLNVITLRPFYVYGPFSNPSTFVSSVIKQIKENGQVILSQKFTKRDFLFIEDFINLLIKILTNFPSGYSLYNVGYGESHSLEEVIQIVEDITNLSIPIIYDTKLRPNDITDMIADIKKVSKSFDWIPLINLRDGLKITLDSYDLCFKQ